MPPHGQSPFAFARGLGRSGDRQLLEGVPPRTPAFLEWDPDPVLDGWEVHEGVFRGLEPYLVRL